MAHWPEFDYVVVNDDFASALERLQAVVAGAGDDARTEIPAVQALATAIVSSG